MNTLKVWIEDSLRTARADIAAGRQDVVLRRHLKALGRNPDAPRRLLP
jgi:hypothetical protein